MNDKECLENYYVAFISLMTVATLHGMVINTGKIFSPQDGERKIHAKIRPGLH